MKPQISMFRFLLLILLPSSYMVHPRSWRWRVVGGTEAAPGQFPYMAMLKRTGYSCSASIVSKSWVVSAAHCIERNDPTLYKVTAGTVDLQRMYDHIQASNVSRLIPHPKFVHHRNSTTDTAIFDICLAQVEIPFTWNEYVKPIQLACASVTYLPTECIGVGFGLRNVTARERASLVPPKSKERAHRRFKSPEKLSYLGLRSPVRPCPELNDQRFPEDHQLCSIGGEVGERHIYLGDSGGPLVCRGLQVGVFSALEPIHGPENKPVIVQVHTSVPYFHHWILDKIAPYGSCDGLKLTLNI